MVSHRKDFPYMCIFSTKHTNIVVDLVPLDMHILRGLCVTFYLWMRIL